MSFGNVNIYEDYYLRIRHIFFEINLPCPYIFWLNLKLSVLSLINIISTIINHLMFVIDD